MGKRILVFADGTGNKGGLLPEERQTNVYKLYNATRVGPGSPIDPKAQVAFYVNGIGTADPGSPPPSWILRRKLALAEAVGYGLRDRITRCYTAIISVRTFKRVPWGGSKTIRAALQGEPQPFEQVWFAGNHADIGGSYPENESRLSDYPLQWIADFIREGLPLDARVTVNRDLLNLHPSRRHDA